MDQTINQAYKRAQGHWWSRFWEDDLLHQALELDETPFSFVILPLEFIPESRYKVAGRQQRATLREFRQVATPRERHWVNQLNSMWPHGWNSAVPGRPVAAWVHRQQPNHLADAPDSQEPGLNPANWVTRWQQDPHLALQEMRQQPKGTIRDTLHHLQSQYRPEDLLNRGQSPIALLIELLRQRRKEAPARQFLRFKFTSNDAQDLQIRSVLRDPTVFHKHPEPECAAAIMVSEHFDL